MSVRFSLSVLFLSSILALGCGESHVVGGDAGSDAPGIIFDLDGAMFDGGVDAPVEPVTVGDACGSEADCTGDGAVCLTMPADLIPGGYCSQACDPGGADPACPDGSSCIDFGMGQAYCFRDCDPGATTRSCPRMGYGCTTSPMLSGVCAAGCFDGSDCPTGLDCNPTGGFLGSGTCFDPAAQPGGPCTMDSDCPADFFCFTEEGSGPVGGACFSQGCDIATNGGCDGSCFPGGGGAGGAPVGLCGADCTTDTDCRAGYSCQPVEGVTGRNYCAPSCTSDLDCTVGGYVCNVGTGLCAEPFDSSLLGQTCNPFRGPACTGGTCITEGGSGFPGAYCAYPGCETPGVACDAAIGGVCTASPTGTGTNYCFAACADDTECRAGYACRPSNPDDPASPGVCWPACTDDSVCNVMRGRMCNVTTGLCE